MDINFVEFFGTLAGFVAGVIGLTQILKNTLKIEKPFWKRATAWIVSILGAIAGLVLQQGWFAEFGDITMWQAWIKTVVVGFVGGLIANGTYSIEFVRPIVDFIFKFLEPKQTQVINE